MKTAFLFCLALSCAFVTACRTERGEPTHVSAIGLDADEPGLQDYIFVREALANGLHEIQIARMGIDRAQNTHVRLLAQRIFDDHTRGNKELLMIAREEIMTLPAPPALPPHAEHLQSAGAEDFDALYLQHLLDMHRADITKFQAASRTARDPDVRSFAAKMVPVMREHVRMAENISRIAGLGRVITEAAGAERPGDGIDPFLGGDPQRGHQFEQQ